MEQTHDELAAAPPDAGGHQGVFTRPGDVLQRTEGHARPQPELDRDPAAPRGRGSTAAVWTWGIAFVLVVLFFLFYAVGRL